MSRAESRAGSWGWAPHGQGLRPNVQLSPSIPTPLLPRWKAIVVLMALGLYPCHSPFLSLLPTGLSSPPEGRLLWGRDLLSAIFDCLKECLGIMIGPSHALTELQWSSLGSPSLPLKSVQMTDKLPLCK